MEQDGRRNSGLLNHASAVAPPAARTAVFVGVVVAGLATDSLDDAVAGNPLRLVAVAKFFPHRRREPPKQIEEGRGIAAHQGAGEREDGAAGFGERARRQALSGAACLVLVLLVDEQEVEVPAHTPGDVVGKRVAAGPPAVRLPERAVALLAHMLLPSEVCLLQWQTLVIDDGRETRRAAGERNHPPCSSRAAPLPATT
ncbi:MAG: hypothetical protein M5U18_19550 [Dehalococcoidia bacterium]|nr:hypothetical protein [Dehalococcoidia bacterium]